jgi:hypothetical protein
VAGLEAYDGGVLRTCAAFVAVQVVAGCAEDCLGVELQVVAFEGPSVVETSVECLDVSPPLNVCATREPRAIVSINPDIDVCGDVRVVLNADLSGLVLVFGFSGEAEVTSPRAEVEVACDEECADSPHSVEAGSWITVERYSPDEVAARFHIDFEAGGSVSGDIVAVRP